MGHTWAHNCSDGVGEWTVAMESLGGAGKMFGKNDPGEDNSVAYAFIGILPAQLPPGVY